MRQYDPMLLKDVDYKRNEELPLGTDWVYQPKLDGFRGVAYVGLERTVLLSRKRTDLTDRFPAVAAELLIALQGHTGVLDGEVVGLDARGREDFSQLQRKMGRVAYCAFDLLELDDAEQIGKPLHERRRLLEEIVTPTDHVWLMPQYDDRDALLAAAVDLDLEGVVAKRQSSLYLPGRRSYAWRRLKFRPGGFGR